MSNSDKYIRGAIEISMDVMVDGKLQEKTEQVFFPVSAIVAAIKKCSELLETPFDEGQIHEKIWSNAAVAQVVLWAGCLHKNKELPLSAFDDYVLGAAARARLLLAVQNAMLTPEELQEFEKKTVETHRQGLLKAPGLTATAVDVASTFLERLVSSGKLQEYLAKLE